MTRPFLPVASGEQRYWRNPGNRRLRSARRTRVAARWTRILAWNLLVALALGLVVARAVHGMRQSPVFVLEQIDIHGTERVEIADLQRALEPVLGTNVLEVDLGEVRSTTERHRWVARAVVKRVLPNALRIDISERRPCAVARVGGEVHVVDEHGESIETVGSDERIALPVLRGLDGLAEKARAPELGRGVEAIQRLRRLEPSLYRDLAGIDLSRPDRLTVETRRPGPPLLLDPRAAERNVGYYLALREEIEARLGAVEYVDLRWQGRITALPRQERGSAF